MHESTVEILAFIILETNPGGTRRPPMLALRSVPTSLAPRPRMPLGDNKQRQPRRPVRIPLIKSAPGPPQSQPPPAHT